MIYSMTGFGRAQREEDGAHVNIEVQSVNRRNLEIYINLPREWQEMERELQRLVRERVQRGKVYVTVQVSLGEAEGGFVWDDKALRASVERLAGFAREQGIEWELTSDSLVRLAALHKVDRVMPEAEKMQPVVEGALAEALSGLVAMREAEGSSLGTDLGERVRAVQGLLEAIGRDGAGTVEQYRDLLLQRLRQSGLGLDIGDERVLKEVALYADKCDISEELTRVVSHVDQMRECLEAGSPVGRKLEFIIQELNREFNTIGSKVNNVDASRHVIEAKNELERIREQIQNIE